MNLKELKLSHFKNYPSAQVLFHPQLNLIVGKNGMGKTNLLEAIHFLALGKSYYNIPDRQLIQFEQQSDIGFFRIEGVDVSGDRYEFMFGQGRKKIVSKNKIAYDRISDHIGNIPVVSIFPEDIEIIKGDAAIRRKFIDNTICQSNSSYLKALMYYNKVLKRKKELLKQFRMRQEDKVLLLDKYDQELAQPAELIVAARVAFTQNFNAEFAQYYQQIGQVPSEQVSIIYQSNLNQQSYLDKVEQRRTDEIQKARALVGPHKDDFSIQLNGKAAKYFSSQGQQKSILFSLKLSQYQYILSILNRKPLLLLDDFFDKLDGQRIINLLKVLSENQFGQIFITDTDGGRMQEIATQVGFAFHIMEIENGRIQ